MKSNTLAGSFGFVGTENGFNHRQINWTSKPFFSTYKSNANTTDLTSQLLKTVNVNVLKSNNNRILSYEKANVLNGGGEVVVFLIAW